MSNRKEIALYSIFPILALLAPVIGNLAWLHKTLFAPPSLLKSDQLFNPLFLLLAFSILIGLVLAVFQSLELKEKQGVSHWASNCKYAVIAGIIFLSLDLSYEGLQISISLNPFANTAMVLRLWNLTFALFVLAGLFILEKLLRDHLIIILTAIFGAFFLISVSLYFYAMGQNEDSLLSPPKHNQNLPPKINIILDEMIGAEGIDRSLENGDAVYSLVRNFHRQHGFNLYGKAFSRHFYTRLSIPNMLNYIDGDNTLSSEVEEHDPPILKYFEDARTNGYDVKVYQSSHINFCGAGNVVSCETLQSYNPFNPYVSWGKAPALGKEDGGITVLRLLLERFKGSFFKLLLTKIGLTGPGSLQNQRYDALSFNRWFDKLSQDVAHASGGELFFAHFLVPHFPYHLDKDCHPKPGFQGESVSLAFLEEDQKPEDDLFREAREKNYSEYFEQVSCVYKKLDQLMSSLKTQPWFDKATIVLHGDHGSRISHSQFYEGMTERDLVDNYSALFSIRGPGIEPGYNLRQVSIQRLFKELMNPTGSGKNPTPEETVAVDSREQKRVIEVPLPDFGNRENAEADGGAGVGVNCYTKPHPLSC